MRYRELAGGLTTALISIPVEMVYGLLAVAPLGTAFAGHGLRAALWACVLSGILGLLLRLQPGMICGSRPASGLILGTLASALLMDSRIQAQPDQALATLELLLLCTALTGGLHLLFGLLRIGRSLRYVPYPVVSGLVCGTGVLMLWAALPGATGTSGGLPTWSDIHPLSVLVTTLCAGICFYRSSYGPIPPPALALFAGMLLHHGLAAAFSPDLLGPTSTEISGLFPAWSLWHGELSHEKMTWWLGWLPTLFPYALAIATLTTLETLICLSTLEEKLHQPPHADQTLRRIGGVNLLIGLAGGTPATANLSRINANLGAGGRGRLSALIYALAITFAALSLGNLGDWIPASTIAGILIFYGVQMIGDSSQALLRQALTQKQQLSKSDHKTVLANGGVLLVVALVAVTTDMMKAVGIGSVLAMMLFVRTSMKPVIRRIRHADQYRSLHVRTGAENVLLSTHGRQICLIECEGTLFFGSVERVCSEIDRQVGLGATWLILDLRRIAEADPSSAHRLIQLARRLQGSGKHLYLSHANRRIERFLQSTGLGAPVIRSGAIPTTPLAHWFPDADHALEAAEEALLSAHQYPLEARQAIHLGDTMLAQALTPAQVDILSTYLGSKTLESEGPVFRYGDEGDCLFVAEHATVDIRIPAKSGHLTRIAAFGPGTFFGEMALLEGKPRSANAVATGKTRLWSLSRTQLAELATAHPDIARQVMINIACALADRLRSTTEEVRRLNDG